MMHYKLGFPGRTTRIFILLIFSLSVFITGCKKIETEITAYPKTAEFRRGKLNSLPEYNGNSSIVRTLNLPGYDLSDLDLKDRLTDLLFSDFDSRTIWPEVLPNGFHPDKIMETGKNPGLQLRTLHAEGFTADGINIAIIGQPLLITHLEYMGRIELYEEINISGSTAQVQGTAVASIAAGKTTGTAPGADIYYTAVSHIEITDAGFGWNYEPVARAVRRILEVNKSLPRKDKIKVIALPLGWNPDDNGAYELDTAVNEAIDDRIFVVSSSMERFYGFSFQGLGREVYADPDSLDSWTPGLWWKNIFYSSEDFISQNKLLVPMDSRTTASPTGNSDYAFYRNGSWSWAVPWIAGLYALACEVYPKIDAEYFWEAALLVANETTVSKSGKEYLLGKIVDPYLLIHALKNTAGDKN